jgi:hypothetical protein
MFVTNIGLIQKIPCYNLIVKDKEQVNILGGSTKRVRSVRERVVRLFLYNHLVGRAIVSEWQAVTFNLFLSRCLTMYSIDHI